MARRVYARDDAGDITEITGSRVLREGWEVTEYAEEGATAMSSLTIDDTSVDFDLVGHRQFRILEDTSEADDDVLFFGFVADQEIGRVAGDVVNPLSRAWTLSVVDGNSLWGRRVMVGTDCKRPAETDVERMQWLVDTSEMGYFDDLTLLSTAAPVNMDKVDYRGQMVQQVADDCAQQSGKNWWIGLRNSGVHRDIFVWYGKDTLATYASDLSLSNDPADWTDAELLDGTSLVWPIAFDTKLKRDPGRVFSGVYLPYENGAVFRQSADTVAEFALSGRDMVAPSLNVKTKAKAVARALRYLDDLDEQDERITTTVELPAAKATMLRAGMRVPFKATHLPGYDDFVDCRVVSCSVAPVHAGNSYRLGLELVPVGPGTPGGSCSTVIAAGESNYALGLESAPSPSVGITPASNTILFAWLAAANQNSTGSTAMAAITGGYTELLNEPGDSKSTYRIAAKSATGGVLSTAASTFTPGFSASGGWMAVQVGLPLASATPVQTKYGPGAKEATLDSPPTTGNVVLVFAHLDSGWGLLPNGDIDSGPTTGWTQLFNHDYDVPGNTRLNMAVFARCVEAGETGEYAFSQTKVGYSTARSIFIAEYAP